MKTLLTSLVLAIAVSVQPLSAQEIDMEQMQQDINIMENILEEMFETNWDQSGSEIHVYSGKMILGEAGNVEGTFFPDYGIIFTVPTLSSGYINYLDDSGEKTNYNTFENGKRVTKESIVNEIIEFLGEYGSTIDQLSGNDKIAVIYKADATENMIVVLSSDVDFETEEIPTISVMADYNDIQSYSSNDISRETFRERLYIDTSNSKKTATDLKIMANILETVFDDNEDEQFISGDVDYLKIDTFGALFSFEIDYGNPFGVPGAMRILADLPEIDLDTDYDFNVARIFEADSLNGDSLHKIRMIQYKLAEAKMKQARKRLQARQKRIKERRKLARFDSRAAFESFLTQLKEYVVDYGPTLDSVAPNQLILFSIDINSRVEDIPERIVLQVEKSVLRAAAANEISAQEAMKEITVRRYQ